LRKVANRQTDKQTDKQLRLHIMLGGGKNLNIMCFQLKASRIRLNTYQNCRVLVPDSQSKESTTFLFIRIQLLNQERLRPMCDGWRQRWEFFAVLML